MNKDCNYVHLRKFLFSHRYDRIRNGFRNLSISAEFPSKHRIFGRHMKTQWLYREVSKSTLTSLLSMSPLLPSQLMLKASLRATSFGYVSGSSTVHTGRVRGTGQFIKLIFKELNCIEGHHSVLPQLRPVRLH